MRTSIWTTFVRPEEINERCKNTLCDYLGIEFTEVGDDFLTATMPVDRRTVQPMGILHGGASCALAESVGSAAANYCIEQKTHIAVGLDININHMRPVRLGLVTAIARPFHLGKTTHVWEIKIYNEDKQLVSVARLTMSILEKR
jgi:1,4-dihydroxy-2-naphthoyl-CoA hydrolase